MGAAAYRRGSRHISREADDRMPEAIARSERQAQKDEVARLREQIAGLERDLARARRCIAELRGSKEERVRELRAELSAAAFGTSILCRLAFPGDAEPAGDATTSKSCLHVEKEESR